MRRRFVCVKEATGWGGIVGVKETTRRGGIARVRGTTICGRYNETR